MSNYKPKVARIITYLPVGGVEKRILAALKKLKNRFEVEVICIHSKGKLARFFEEEGIPVSLIPFRSGLHPYSLWRLANYLKKRKIDIVHTHMYEANISGVLAAKMARVPVIISNIHNIDQWDNKRERLIDRIFYRMRGRTIAVSHAVKNNLIKVGKVQADDIIVIYNGIDTKEFDIEGAGIERCKNEFNISKGEFIIIIIARIVPRKGHKYLFRAVKELERYNKKIRVLVVGDGFYKGELKKKVADLGLGKCINFLGERNDVAALLKISNVSVLPSKKEGFSNVILESMAAAIPVIASDVGGAREAIENGINGFIVRVKDIRDLEYILKLCMYDYARSARIGKLAKEKVKKSFSIDHMVKATSDLYMELLKTKKKDFGISFEKEGVRC